MGDKVNCSMHHLFRRRFLHCSCRTAPRAQNYRKPRVIRIFAKTDKTGGTNDF